MNSSETELAELYRRYGFVVERRCARILGNAADGRDAAHEAFARAWAKLGSFRAENERLAWLYRISTNVCLNLLRERKSRGDAWKQQVEAVTSRPPEDLEKRTVQKATARKLLETAEDELTASLAIHVYLDELSQGEAAELLGVSRATANARLSRFREQARDILEEAA